jgi:hypothetical protein
MLLLQLLTCKPLPESQEEFLSQLGLFFPLLIDAKCLCPKVPGRPLAGPLNTVSDLLGFDKLPKPRQSGVASIQTSAVFFRLRDTLVGVEGSTADTVEDRFNGMLWSLKGAAREAPVSGAAVAAASTATRVARGPH